MRLINGDREKIRQQSDGSEERALVERFRITPTSVHVTLI